MEQYKTVVCRGNVLHNINGRWWHESLYYYARLDITESDAIIGSEAGRIQELDMWKAKNNVASLYILGLRSWYWHKVGGFRLVSSASARYYSIDVDAVRLYSTHSLARRWRNLVCKCVMPLRHRERGFIEINSCVNQNLPTCDVWTSNKKLKDL